MSEKPLIRWFTLNVVAFKQARAASGISQAVLAKSINGSRAWIHLLEKPNQHGGSTRKVRQETVVQLASVLRVQPASLVLEPWEAPPVSEHFWQLAFLERADRHMLLHALATRGAFTLKNGTVLFTADSDVAYLRLLLSERTD